MYGDVWMHELRETWQVVVHSLQRVDLHALVGQTSATKLVLKGNMITEIAELDHMVALEVLDASENQLKAFPPALPPSLVELDLYCLVHLPHMPTPPWTTP